MAWPFASVCITAIAGAVIVYGIRSADR